jgi:hypothetical protein
MPTYPFFFEYNSLTCLQTTATITTYKPGVGIKTVYATVFHTRYVTSQPTETETALLTKTVGGSETTTTAITDLVTATSISTVTDVVTNTVVEWHIVTLTDVATVDLTTDITSVTTVDSTSVEVTSITTDVTTDVVEVSTVELTTVDTLIQTTDFTIIQTITQTADITDTQTISLTATTTETAVVEETSISTITSTSSVTITETGTTVIPTVLPTTIDVTSTDHITETVDITVTATITTTTTTTITSTAEASPTCGVNVVQNPGFSNGNGATLLPWKYLPSSSGGYAFVAGRSANNDIALGLFTRGAGSASPAISQTLSTIPGRIYTVSFWYFGVNGNAATSYLRCSASNSGQSSIIVRYIPNRLRWLQTWFTFSATSTSTTLTCQLVTNTPAGVYLDDISVVSSCGNTPMSYFWAGIIIPCK